MSLPRSLVSGEVSGPVLGVGSLALRAFFPVVRIGAMPVFVVVVVVVVVAVVVCVPLPLPVAVIVFVVVLYRCGSGIG